MNTLHPEFDWKSYGQTVYEIIQHFREDLERVKNHLDELEKVINMIGAIRAELENMRREVERLSDLFDKFQRDFQECRLQSVTKGGENKQIIALLKQEVKTELKKHNTNRATLISAISSVITGSVVLLINYFINHHK